MSEQLTDEQVKDWRNVLCGIFGPYALVMSVTQIQAFRDKVQERANKSLNAHISRGGGEMATKDLNTRCPLPMPEYFTVPWARQWIAAAGGDPGLVRDTWCWADFGQHYPELIPVFVEYLKRATTGDPAWTAHWAREAGWMSTEDAVAVIKEARTGDLAWAAYWARREGWMSKREAITVEKKEEERDDR